MNNHSVRLAQALSASEAYVAELNKMVNMFQDQEREIVQRIARLKCHMRYVKIYSYLRRGQAAVAAFARVQMAQQAQAASVAPVATENVICSEHGSSSIIPYFHEDIVVKDSRRGVIKSVLSTPDISDDGLFLRNVRSRMMVFNKKPRHWTKSELILLREEAVTSIAQGEQTTSKTKKMTECDWEALAMLFEANHRTVEECKRQASCSSTYLAGASPWGWSKAEDRQLELLVAQRSRDLDWTCIATALSQTTCRDGTNRRPLLPVECLKRYQQHVGTMKAYHHVDHQEDENGNWNCDDSKSITSKSVQRKGTVNKKSSKRQQQLTIIQKGSRHHLKKKKKKKDNQMQQTRRMVLKEWCYRDKNNSRVNTINRSSSSIMDAIENEGQRTSILKSVFRDIQTCGV